MSSPRNRLPRRTQDYVTVALFLLPAVILFVLFLIYPIFRSVYYSTFNWNGMGPAIKFVGLNNFKQILTDQVFQKAIENCIIIVVFSLAIQLPLALLLAIMVGRDLPGRVFFRSVKISKSARETSPSLNPISRRRAAALSSRSRRRYSAREVKIR